MGVAPSSLVNFISETILLGFKAGAALTIGLTQLPKLFNVPGGGDGFFERLWVLGSQLGDTNVAVLAFGLVAIGVLVAGERFFPGRPVALAVVAASIVALSRRRSRRWDSSWSARCRRGSPSLRCRRCGRAMSTV
jgi:MFS superfamily sulfate permease-like transporter